jgi:hypothetical protein
MSIACIVDHDRAIQGRRALSDLTYLSIIAFSLPRASRAAIPPWSKPARFSHTFDQAATLA